MLERRILILVSALIVLLASAALWNAFVRRPPRAAEVSPAGADSSVVTTTGAPPSGASRTAPTPAAVAPPLGSDAGGPSYIVLLARSEIRRRIRASAGLTYLNEIVAESADSEIHRWDGRVSSPVRVLLAPSTTANFQPAFLDQVRAAFQTWVEAGVPVRFNFDTDSASAEVRFQWKIQFEGEKSGQTDVLWDDEGKLTGGTVTLATFDPKGQPIGPDDVRVIALHEIGHLLGLDHSKDPGDIMYAQPKVRDLSPHDIATVQLLYDLAPGSLRGSR